MKKDYLFDLQFRSQITDFQRRSKYKSKELDCIILKSLHESLNEFVILEDQITITSKLQHLKQNTIVRVRNRCVISGRNSTLKKSRLSRIAFRSNAACALLPGVTKRLNK